MTASIVKEGQVSLNSIIFPLADEKEGKGKVRPSYLPRFPGKIITGDVDYANEEYLSNEIAKDLRDGLGAEEYLSNNRYWFGNLQTRFNGHRTLPPLVTSVSLPALPAISQAGAIPWTVDNGSQTRNDDATGWSNDFRNCLITVTISYAVTKYGGGTLDLHFHLNDGIGDVATSSSVTDTGSGTITLSAQLSATATRIRITATLAASPGGTSATVSTLTYSMATAGTFGPKMTDFNSDSYFSRGSVLYRIDNATGNIFLDALMPATITDLLSSIGNCLYVFLGDTANYWYRSNASPQVWTQTNVANATKGVQHAGKLWKLNAAGQISYAAAPNSATPSWTNDATLTDNGLPSGACESLYTAFDNSGAACIVAATHSGRYQLDTTVSKFIFTNLGLANHPNGGKGGIFWNNGEFVTAGLAVKKYQAGSSAVISDVGLDQGDGIPTEYAGEIVRFIDGLDTLYVLVDASQTAGLGYSAIYAYDGTWRCFWDGSLLDSYIYSFSSSSGTGWANLANAYDGNTANYASSPSVSAAQWSAYAQFNITAANSHQLKFYASSDGNGTVNQIDIDVSTNGANWTDVYNGTFTADTWASYHFPLSAITNVRVRFYNNHSTTAGIGYLKEIQLASSTCDGTMHTGILSSTYAYRLWFDHNSVLYYIPMSRNNLNPKKVSGSTYSASGLFWSSWLDGGTKAFTKAIKRVTEFCAGTSATETVKVWYRLDHTYTDLFTGWTLLGTAISDGATQMNFSSGAGLEFKSFQYLLELARTTTNTLSPDVQADTISYRKNLGMKHAWSFRVDLADAGANLRTMISNLETAMSSNVWIPFVFRDTTKETSQPYYVEIVSCKGVTGAGPDYESQYDLTVVEV